MNAAEVIGQLKALSNPANVAGMARFGINPKGSLGIPVPALRALAKKIGMDHALAQGLWASGIHEARVLASMVEDPARVTSTQLEAWVQDFDSWDVCDQVCDNLIGTTRFAARKAVAWAGRKPEYIRRAGYTLMAVLAWHDPMAGDELFIDFLKVIERGATDDRNFVKKAVNWALRNIGKRNRALNRAALASAQNIALQDSRAARWIAADARRELLDIKTKARLDKKEAAQRGKRKKQSDRLPGKKVLPRG
jgi:3-methyladenine DNA glycosylase AlkD